MLCGGLASGKSLVRRLLEEHGVDTIDADSVGHTVLQPDGPAFAGVAARWPHVVRNGEIDRRSLADVVFSDQGELDTLEALTHPHIFDLIRARVEDIEAPVVVEIPLISHGLGDEWRRIVVDCRDDVRLERAVSRGMDETDARARMNAQPARSEWLAVADVVVPNHRTVDELQAAVARLVPLL